MIAPPNMGAVRVAPCYADEADDDAPLYVEKDMDCYNFSVKQVQQRLSQQRGKKHGVEYVPWFTVQEVGSIGCVHQFRLFSDGWP